MKYDLKITFLDGTYHSYRYNEGKFATAQSDHYITVTKDGNITKYPYSSLKFFELVPAKGV